MTPREAYNAGYCPMCCGQGEVYRLVPVEGLGPCSGCGGQGTLAAMLNALEQSYGPQLDVIRGDR